MPKLKRTEQNEKFGAQLESPKYVGYLDCLLDTPLKAQIVSRDEETRELKVSIHDGSGLLIPHAGNCTAPFESKVEHVASGVFSPVFLVENETPKEVALRLSVTLGGKEVCGDGKTVVALPFDWWEGLAGNPERLAAFVRPRLSECSRILEDAGKRLKKWTSGADVYGYTGADKNAVRMTAAAVFAAIKGWNIERENSDISSPICAFSQELFRAKRGSVLQLALFAAACLEAAKLNPVLAVGKRRAAVGVWLHAFNANFTEEGKKTRTICLRTGASTSPPPKSTLLLRWADTNISSMCAVAASRGSPFFRSKKTG